MNINCVCLIILFVFNIYRGKAGRRRGPNARADINVSLEEMYKGSQRSVNINRNIYCTQCNGTGAKDGKFKKCNRCKGQG